MRKLFLCFAATLAFIQAQSQVAVNNTNTVASYVQNVLLGPGVTVTNITINGAPATSSDQMVGEFTDPTSSVGLASGMILGTGDVNLAAQPNTGGSSSLGGGGNSAQDPDLAAISTNTLFNQCILEFDFVPTGDTLTFNYVFASEEYEEYVCSGFNDVFGFFLTGNHPVSGQYNGTNIALVPDPLNPGQYTTTAVAINTINPGVAGSFGTASNCAAQDPNWASYNVFYQTNSTTNYEYDGRTVALTAFAWVNCGEVYHIKIAIGDAGDPGFDSGVFLEEGSFGTNGTVDATQAIVPPNILLCDTPYTINVSAGTNPPPSNYWDFGDGLGTDTSAHPLYTYGDTGVYTVMYVAIDSSACIPSDTAYFTVEIIKKDSLDAQFSFPPYDPCDSSVTVQLDFTGTGADSLFWDMGDGTQFINDTSITYTYNTPGVYIITFEAYDTICNNTQIITDTVFFTPNITTVNAVVPPNILMCETPFEVNFTGNVPQPPNNYWDFGDGIGNSTQHSPTYIYGDTGTYQVMYVAIDSSTCNIADTAYFNVVLQQAPPFSATLDFQPPPPCGNDTFLVTLNFTGSGADSLIWDLGDGSQFINIDSMTYIYSSPGTYTVTMTAYNYLCNFSETVSNEVTFTEVTSEESIIPNVFTPNGDGMNDYLEFMGVDQTQEYSIKIFNRWGTKVYEGTDALAHWDGENQSSGIYFYELRFTDVCSDEEKLVTGYVTLLR